MYDNFMSGHRNDRISMNWIAHNPFSDEWYIVKMNMAIMMVGYVVIIFQGR